MNEMTGFLLFQGRAVYTSENRSLFLVDQVLKELAIKVHGAA
jgi:hypothetical protein